MLFTGLDRCSALSCEYHCHESPQGGTCYCPDGYAVANDSRSCVGECCAPYLFCENKIQVCNFVDSSGNYSKERFWEASLSISE